VDRVLEVATVASALETAVRLPAFSSNAVVHWNGTALATTVVSPSRLDAAVPASLIANAGTASVTVVDGATSAPATFTIDPPLAIDSLEPSMVVAGGAAFTLEVDGVGFGSDAQVEWNGAALKTTVVSELEVTAAVTADLIASPGVVSITVATGGAKTAPAQLAIVAPGPAISELEPSIAPAGGGGFTLTVAGSGFASGAAIQWNGAALPTTFTSDREVSAPVPASLVTTPGTAQVTAVSGGVTSNAKPFTIGGADPQIGSFEQAVAIAGGSAFQLVVRGINFGKDAVVNWSTNALTTTWDDASQVTATVPANLVTAAGAVPVTVESGGVTSAPLDFVVIAPQPGIGLLEPSSAVAGGPGFTLSVTGGFGAGDFAIQMVAAPELQGFLPTQKAS
jgi:hypothetical protein